MYRKKFIAVLVVLGISVCGTAASAIVKYNFSQSGFDEGAIVTGMFEGEDIDGDGFLVGLEDSDFKEVTAFNMAFSGNSIVPAVEFDLDDLVVLSLNLSSGDLIDLFAQSNGSSGLIEYFPAGPVSGVCKSCTAIVLSTEDPIVDVRETFSLESVKVSAVPLPATVWLFGSGLLGLFGMARIKVPTESKKA
jgi:hypothetical protein